MNHNLEIQKTLLKIDTVSHPEDKISLLKQAIQVADANNDLDWGFDLRLDLISLEKDTSHCTESFPAFTWVLSAYDANPELFNEDDFLWEYKWMAAAARRNVNISRQQVEAIMADLKVRMERNGYTLRGYYSVMIYWYLFIGDMAEANRFLELRDSTPRDRMSHCPACELDTRVEMELIQGLFDKAITTANDLITKKLTCGVMPLTTFCNLTYYLSKAGDERAADFFAKAEEEIADTKENDSSLISNISDVIFYLNKYDRSRAWEYFQRYADWEIGAEDAISFDFSKNILTLLKEEGSRQLTMSEKLPYFRADGNYRIADLYDYYYQKAKNLAQQFDARNGTNSFAKALDEIISL